MVVCAGRQINSPPLPEKNESMRPQLEALRAETSRLFNEATELKHRASYLDQAQQDLFKVSFTTPRLPISFSFYFTQAESETCGSGSISCSVINQRLNMLDLITPRPLKNTCLSNSSIPSSTDKAMMNHSRGSTEK